MATRDDELRILPGRVHHGDSHAKRPQNFVDEVMRAAKRAGIPAKLSAARARDGVCPSRAAVAWPFPVVAITEAPGHHHHEADHASSGPSGFPPPKANTLPATIGGE